MSQRRPPLAREGLRCGVCGHEEYADRIESTEAPMAQHMARVHPTEDWFDANGRYHVHPTEDWFDANGRYHPRGK